MTHNLLKWFLNMSQIIQIYLGLFGKFCNLRNRLRE